jgi:hypothetical protein
MEEKDDAGNCKRRKKEVLVVVQRPERDCDWCR